MARIRRCPICKNPLPEGEGAARYRPFCSKRCAEIDLGKWLTGSYAIPATEEESEDEEEGGTPKPAADTPLSH
ncbi:MAG: DNA gyrase inhibitor YacG [Alphaproteobacteria bacterium]|nr:DNA gyrase inhibitor YacG [Alphaproteobacteria bacterium]